MNYKYGRYGRLIALAIAALFTSCTIEEAPLVPSPPIGNIYVSAEDTSGVLLPGGAIFLDGELRAGKQTPDTIQSSPGDHQIWVELVGFIADTQTVAVVADSTIDARFELEPLGVGTAFVMATDSATGDTLSGAMVFLNGALTDSTSPAILPEIQVGRYAIGAALPGYDFRDDSVDILSGATQTVVLALPPVPWNGIIHITANVADAQVCVDDRLMGSTVPWVVHGLAGGVHDYSCYLNGYATLSPNLKSANLYSYGYDSLTFNLEPGTIGYQEGKLAPGFALISDASDTVALGGYRGRVVLINFWFRDCQPCMEEMPDIQQVYEELGGQGFRVLAVNPMFSDNQNDLLEVRDLLDLTFEMLMDQGYAVTQGYAANQFPTNVLIDQSGVVDWYTSSLEYADLKARVQALLNP